MNANKQAKVNLVSEINNKIKESSSLVIAKYAGLTVKETQELRNQLREQGVELKVYKNRLVKLALQDTDFAELESVLTGPNAIAFGSENDIAPAKVLATFAKDHKALELVAGTFEGKVIDVDGVKEVATLPTLEEALTKLALALITPVKDLGISLNLAVEEGHISGDAAAEAPAAEEAPAEETPAAEATEETTEEAPAAEEATEENNAEEAPAEEEASKEEVAEEATEKEGE